jgi:hypothetical protein
VDHAGVGVEGADRQQVVGVGEQALGRRITGEVPIGGVQNSASWDCPSFRRANGWLRCVRP